MDGGAQEPIILQHCNLYNTRKSVLYYVQYQHFICEVTQCYTTPNEIFSIGIK